MRDITCELLVEDVPVVSFDLEASEDDEGGVDYFNLLGG
jgi:hypothetical protein